MAREKTVAELASSYFAREALPSKKVRNQISIVSNVQMTMP